MKEYTVRLENTFEAEDINQAREMFWDWIADADNSNLIIEVEDDE